MVSSDGDELNEAVGPNPDTSTPKVVNEVGENDVGTGPPISTPNPGSSSYANVTGKPSRKKVNFRTLFTPAGNRIDVVFSVEFIRTISERFSNTVYVWVKLPGVLVTEFSEDGLSAIATKLGTPLVLDSYTSDMC
nr:hypothetical protein [Tanacetum cinerariifolium]